MGQRTLAEVSLAGVLLLWCGLAGVFGEKVQANAGLGWDGREYADWSAREPRTLVGQLDSYYVQRVGPSIAVHCGAAALGWRLDSARSVILAFTAFDLLMIAASLATWWLLSAGWSPPLRVLSFAGLFVNYAVLKMTPYYPVLCDTAAFTLGLLVVWLHLRGAWAGVLLVTALGAFVFPTLALSGAVLLALPARLERAEPPRSPWLERAPALVVALLLPLVGCVVHLRGLSPARPDQTPVTTAWLVPAALALGAYLYVALRPLISTSALTSLVRALCPRRVAVGVATLAVLTLVVRLVSAPRPAAYPAASFLLVLTQEALVAPLGFLVSHTAYFGPFVLLAALRWRDVTATLREHPGLHALASLYLLLGIGTQSRQFINAWPLIVVATCLTLARATVSWRTTITIAVASLVASRVWLPLNHGPWRGTREFPAQWYFMSQGPYMSPAMYGVFLVGAVVLLAVVALALREARVDPAVTRE